MKSIRHKLIADYSLSQGIAHLVKVYNPYAAVVLNDNICKKVGKHICICFRGIVCIYNIAVYIGKRIVSTEELTDLKPLRDDII